MTSTENGPESRRPATNCRPNMWLVMALWLGLIHSAALSGPKLTVERRGMTIDGNLRWQVSVIPDGTLFTSSPTGPRGSLGVEIGFESIAGGKILSFTPNAQLWPMSNPGHNPFAQGITSGVWVNADAGRAFVSLGSGTFTNDAPVPLGSILTAGTDPAVIRWGGYELLDGTKFEFIGGRISQKGLNFDQISGTLPQRLGDLDSDADVDSADLLQLVAGWTGALDAPDLSIHFEQGDFDGDYDVDSNDLVIFLSSWTGAGAERAAVQVVPEPVSSSWMVLVGSWSALLLARRRAIYRTS